MKHLQFLQRANESVCEMKSHFFLLMTLLMPSQISVLYAVQHIERMKSVIVFSEDINLC